MSLPQTMAVLNLTWTHRYTPPHPNMWGFAGEGPTHSVFDQSSSSIRTDILETVNRGVIIRPNLLKIVKNLDFPPRPLHLKSVHGRMQGVNGHTALSG